MGFGYGLTVGAADERDGAVFWVDGDDGRRKGKIVFELLVVAKERVGVDRVLVVYVCMYVYIKCGLLD